MKQKIPAEPVPKPQLPSFPQMKMENESKVITPSFNQIVPQITPSLMKNDGNSFKPPIPAQTAFTCKFLIWRYFFSSSSYKN